MIPLRRLVARFMVDTLTLAGLELGRPVRGGRSDLALPTSRARLPSSAVYRLTSGDGTLRHLDFGLRAFETVDLGSS